MPQLDFIECSHNEGEDADSSDDEFDENRHGTIRQWTSLIGRLPPQSHQRGGGGGGEARVSGGDPEELATRLSFVSMPRLNRLEMIHCHMNWFELAEIVHVAAPALCHLVAPVDYSVECRRLCCTIVLPPLSTCPTNGRNGTVNGKGSSKCDHCQREVALVWTCEEVHRFQSQPCPIKRQYWCACCIQSEAHHCWCIDTKHLKPFGIAILSMINDITSSWLSIVCLSGFCMCIISTVHCRVMFYGYDYGMTSPCSSCDPENPANFEADGNNLDDEEDDNNTNDEDDDDEENDRRAWILGQPKPSQFRYASLRPPTPPMMPLSQSSSRLPITVPRTPPPRSPIPSSPPLSSTIDAKQASSLSSSLLLPTTSSPSSNTRLPLSPSRPRLVQLSREDIEREEHLARQRRRQFEAAHRYA
jgi:hypothetical protein